MSGQLKRLESQQVELLKTFDRHLPDVEKHLAQNKTVHAERAYRWFFETYDELEKNRRQQRQFLKPKYLESFDAESFKSFQEFRCPNFQKFPKAQSFK